MSITTTNSLFAYQNSCLPETSVNKVCTNPADSTNFFTNNTPEKSTDIEINSDNASVNTKAIKREIDINKLKMRQFNNASRMFKDVLKKHNINIFTTRRFLKIDITCNKHSLVRLCPEKHVDKSS